VTREAATMSASICASPKATQAPRKVFIVRCASGVTAMRQRAVGAPPVSAGVGKCTPEAVMSWRNT
jgi:hypothetical protein